MPPDDETALREVVISILADPAETQRRGRNAQQLRALGVTRLDLIAAWDDAEIDRIDARLGRFQGRIRRDDWPAQARLLAAGDTAGYEAKFGRL